MSFWRFRQLRAPEQTLKLMLRGLIYLGISESEEVGLSNEKIDQVDRFTYLDSIVSKDSGSR